MREQTVAPGQANYPSVPAALTDWRLAAARKLNRIAALSVGYGDDDGVAVTARGYILAGADPAVDRHRLIDTEQCRKIPGYAERASRAVS